MNEYVKTESRIRSCTAGNLVEKNLLVLKLRKKGESGLWGGGMSKAKEKDALSPLIA